MFCEVKMRGTHVINPLIRRLFRKLPKRDQIVGLNRTLLRILGLFLRSLFLRSKGISFHSARVT